MTALGLALLASYGLFAIAGFAGLAVLALLWPWLRQPESRRRAIWILVLIAAGATCLVVGQKLLDDVIYHVRTRHAPPAPSAVEPAPAGSTGSTPS